MKKVKLTMFLMPLLIFQYGCTNNSSSDLLGASGNGPITYTQTTKAIIDNNCVSCHATVPVNGAPMSLTTYVLVKDAVLNRGLLDRISRPQGAQGMMPNGGTRLPQPTINKVFQWAQNNLPE
ncbi:hypothetical protein [Flavobacterium sp.]|uniref:hypothetical protein n=1 Tax=Flavobacterium sp. TaxID=239 RepID=UPI0025E6E1D7|nr:hypothetical protein [Flavobacterium sp.]